MTDATMRQASGYWLYNHGFRRGPSYVGDGALISGAGTWGEWGVPSIAGMNKLFGDGHVTWAGRSELNPTAMNTFGASTPRVMAYWNPQQWECY